MDICRIHDSVYAQIQSEEQEEGMETWVRGWLRSGRSVDPASLETQGMEDTVALPLGFLPRDLFLSCSWHKNKIQNWVTEI